MLRIFFYLRLYILREQMNLRPEYFLSAEDKDFEAGVFFFSCPGF